MPQVQTLSIAEQIVNSGRTIGRDVLAQIHFRIADNLKYMRHRSMLRGDDIAWMINGKGQFIPYNPEGASQTPGRIVARTLTTFHTELLQEFDPEGVYGTIHDVPLSKSKITMPIVRAIVLEDIRNAASELNMAIWVGVRNPNGTTSIANFDGFDTIVTKERASINLGQGNYIQLGQLTPYNIGEKLELMWLSADERLKGDDTKKLIMFMPPVLRDMYIKWYNNHFATAQYTKEYNQIYLHCSNGRCELACPPGTSGIKHIILTTRDNMRIGTDGIGEGDNATGTYNLRVPNNPRLVQLYVDCWMGVNFAAVTKEYLMCGSFTYNLSMSYATTSEEKLSIGEVTRGDTSTSTFTVSGVNLTGSLTVTVVGSNKFTVSKDTITAEEAMTPGGETVTVTFSPTDTDEDLSATIIVASATDDIYLEIPVTGTGVDSE